MIGEVRPAVDARIGAVTLWQVGLERLHHGDLAAAVRAAWAGCDGRPCGAVTPFEKNRVPLQKALNLIYYLSTTILICPRKIH